MHDKGAPEHDDRGPDAGTAPTDGPAHEHIDPDRLALTVTEAGSGRPLPGDVVYFASGDAFGRYRIERCVGQGGMGVVYAARDPDLERTVALKLLSHDHREGSITQARRRRLLREARAMARLEHPNVLTVYEVGTIEDRDFIAMAFADGGTLASWMRDADPPRSWTDIARVFTAAARGLEAAHEVGLVHRDFKPGNVLMSKSGRAMVTDFGLARMDDGSAGDGDSSAVVDVIEDSSDCLSEPVDLTRTGALLGTPAYMAPEQHRGHPADARSDQYSFCVALYEGLFGVRPFTGSDLAGLLRAKEALDVTRPRSGEDVPVSLRDAIMRGLAPASEDRHPSMARLIEAIDGVCCQTEGRAQGHPAPGPWARYRSWFTRILGIALVVLATSVAFVMMDDDPDRAARPSASVVGAEPPEDPVQAAAVAELRSRLADVDRLVHAGDFQGAMARAGESIARARDIGFAPVVAEALFERARLDRMLLAERSMRDALQEATLLAQESVYDELLARIAVFRAEADFQFSSDRDKHALAVRSAAAAMARIGEQPALAARLDLLHAREALAENRHQEAEDLARRALAVLTAKQERLHAADAYAVLTLIQRQDGRLSSALESARESMRLYIEEYGPRHVALAEPFASLVDVLGILGLHQESQRIFDDHLWFWQDPGARAFFDQVYGVVLDETRPVRGVVRDRRSGAPVAGARVAAAHKISSDGRYLQRAIPVHEGINRQLYIVATDATGAFEFPALPLPARVVAAEFGATRSTGSILPATGAVEPVELWLEPTTRVTGMLDVGDAPHMLELLAADPVGNVERAIEVPIVNNTFTIERVLPGSYNLRDFDINKQSPVMLSRQGPLVVPPRGLQGVKLAFADQRGHIDVEIVVRDRVSVSSAIILITPPGVRSGPLVDVRAQITVQAHRGVWQSEHNLAAPGERHVEAVFNDIPPGPHSICVLPLPGDRESPDVIRELTPNELQLLIECQPVDLPASDERHRVEFMLGTHVPEDSSPAARADDRDRSRDPGLE